MGGFSEFQYGFYKEMYYREHHLSERIDSSLAWPASILAAILTVTAYQLGQLQQFSPGLGRSVCIAMCIAVAVPCMVAGYCLIRVIRTGLPRHYLATAGEIGSYVSRMREYCEAEGIEDVDAFLEEDLKAELTQSFIEKAELNARRNFAKLDYRYSAFRWLALALALLCLSTAAFSGRQYLERSSAHPVTGRIVPRRNAMTHDQGGESAGAGHNPARAPSGRVTPGPSRTPNGARGRVANDTRTQAPASAKPAFPKGSEVLNHG